MKYLKLFENSDTFESFGVNKDDVIECFDSFIDDFYITVNFCKKLHQFNVIDTKVTSQDIKLGFVPYIHVRMKSKDSTSGYYLHTYIHTDLFKNLKVELQSRLSMYNLILKDINIEANSLIFLIYIEDEM